MCFEHLAFLNTSNPIRSGESNYNVEDITVDDVDSEVVFDGTVEELSNTPDIVDTERPSTSSSFRSDDMPQRKKRKYKSVQDSCTAVTLIEKATSLLESTNKTDDLDTIDTFLI